jgi:hypothetical protein
MQIEKKTEKQQTDVSWPKLRAIEREARAALHWIVLHEN